MTPTRMNPLPVLGWAAFLVASGPSFAADTAPFGKELKAIQTAICGAKNPHRIIRGWNRDLQSALSTADFERAKAVLSKKVKAGDKEARQRLARLRALTRQEKHCYTLGKIQFSVVIKRSAKDEAALKRRFVSYYRDKNEGRRVLKKIHVLQLRSGLYWAEKLADFPKQKRYLTDLDRVGYRPAAGLLRAFAGRDVQWKREQTKAALDRQVRSRWPIRPQIARLKKQLRALYRDDPKTAEKFIAALPKVKTKRRTAAKSNRSQRMAQNTRGSTSAGPGKSRKLSKKERDALVRTLSNNKGKRKTHTADGVPLVWQPGPLAQIFRGRLVSVRKSVVVVHGRFMPVASGIQAIECRLTPRTSGIRYRGSDKEIRKWIGRQVRVGAIRNQCVRFEPAFSRKAKAAMAPAATIHGAAQRGDLAAVKRMVSSGTRPDKRDKRGITPLFLAAFAGKAEVVRWLTTQRIQIDRDVGRGNTALLAAARQGHLAVVRALVAAGANIEVGQGTIGTPLYWAAKSGRLKVTKYLIKKQAKLNAGDKYGRTALHGAAEFGRTAIVRALLASGADRKVKRSDGLTPVMLAAIKGRGSAVTALTNGSKVNFSKRAAERSAPDKNKMRSIRDWLIKLGYLRRGKSTGDLASAIRRFQGNQVFIAQTGVPTVRLLRDLEYLTGTHRLNDRVLKPVCAFKIKKDVRGVPDLLGGCRNTIGKRDLATLRKFITLGTRAIEPNDFATLVMMGPTKVAMSFSALN